MNFLIMHGSYGGPTENWFTWLKNSLQAAGHTVILEQFPVDDWNTIETIGPQKIGEYIPQQSLSSWESYFLQHILPQINNKPTVFIGHSIAPIFMLHMLEKHDFKLAGAIFVAPFFNIPDRSEIWQFYPVNKTFYAYDFNFEKIKSSLEESYVVYGDDDPYVPASEPPLFAQKLGSHLEVIEGGGHCGSKFKEFPLIFELAKRFVA